MLTPMWMSVHWPRLFMRTNHTIHLWHHVSTNLTVILWKMVGQYLILNIVPNNFMVGTGWKVWCDQPMSLPLLKLQMYILFIINEYKDICVWTMLRLCKNSSCKWWWGLLSNDEDCKLFHKFVPYKPLVTFSQRGQVSQTPNLYSRVSIFRASKYPTLHTKLWIQWPKVIPSGETRDLSGQSLHPFSATTFKIKSTQ